MTVIWLLDDDAGSTMPLPVLDPRDSKANSAEDDDGETGNTVMADAEDDEGDTDEPPEALMSALPSCDVGVCDADFTAGEPAGVRGIRVVAGRDVAAGDGRIAPVGLATVVDTFPSAAGSAAAGNGDRAGRLDGGTAAPGTGWVLESLNLGR